ncbi:hypothetical protein TK34_22120 (plasmid) [Aeromonas hydrophila]|nr:hypothetical protein TK34_22120 [Aeromonas hydrophila]
MARASIDWQFHISNYVEHHADSMSLLEYALANDLNRHSARRSMSAAVAAALAERQPADQVVQPAGQPPSDAAIKVGKVVRQQARQMTAESRRGKGSKRGGSTSDQVAESDQISASDQVRLSDQSVPDQSSQKPKDQPKDQKKTRSTPKKGRSGGGAREDGSGRAADQNFQEHCPTRPNNGAVGPRYGDFGGVHTMDFGGYCSLLELDDEIRDLALATSHGNRDLLLAQGRYMTMYRKQNQILKRIAENYQGGGAWIDDEGNKMPQDQAEAQAIFGISQRMTELESSIARHKLGILKLELDREKMALEQRKQSLAEWNRHPLSRAERIARTAELLELREHKGLSALETATMFNREDIELPAALHAEMLKEITWLEPLTEQGSGITMEELERESREYQEKQRKVREEWLPARNGDIAAIIAEEAAHQAGELLGEQAFQNGKDGELILAGDDGAWDPDHALPPDDDEPAREEWDEETWEAQ